MGTLDCSERYLKLFSSDLAQAREAIGEMLEYIQRCCLVESGDCFELRLAVHEAVINAILHGNCGCREKEVELCCWVDQGRLWIRVKDTGPGFDYRTRCQCQSTEEDALLREDGRGLQIIFGCMDQVLFNPAGNEITMVKKLGLV